jgi:hypothetical protein
MTKFGRRSQQVASDESTRIPRVVAMRRAVADWFIPPGVKRILLRAVRRRQLEAVTRAERAILAANARLQGAYAGRRCFVIGNGPSLAGVDLEPLAGEITVVMNAFNQHPALRRWQPVVHCMAEPATAYSDPECVRQLEQFLVGYTTTTHVFPIGVKAVIDRTGLLPPERCAFVKEDGRTAAEFDHIDLSGPVPAAHDTSILAVSVAIAMGCDPIVLLGVDYNWLSHRLVHSHFYDDAAVEWPAEDLSRSPYLDSMRESVQCWEAHAALGRIAARSGQTILNATEGSFLDVYPTTTLAAVLAGAG